MPVPTAAQDRCLVDLTAVEGVVAVDAVLLPGGALSLTGRAEDGRVVRAIAVNALGEDLEPAAILDRLVAARAQAQRDEVNATRHLRAHVTAQVAAGADVNLAELARKAGIARSTLYLWRDDAPQAAVW